MRLRKPTKYRIIPSNYRNADGTIFLGKIVYDLQEWKNGDYTTVAQFPDADRAKLGLQFIRENGDNNVN